MAPTAFLHPFARPAAEHFVNMVRGEGAAVWDDTGKRYVDAMASLWYCQVGHGRTGDRRGDGRPDGEAGGVPHL
jgi:putrescine aminotransferase